MKKILSRDGTPIAFDRCGEGPAVIVVDGALCYRASGPSGPLAELLSKNFTVYTYDRRGRGDSGNTAPYSVEREVEDIGALIQEAGGSAHVYGMSSGAALALEAACQGLSIHKLALFEAPFIVDNTRAPLPDDYLPRLNQLVGAGKRGAAVRMFMKLVGVPGFFIAMMRLMPVWSKLVAVAHTLPYDISIVQDYQKGKPLPENRWKGIEAPTLVVDGGKSPNWMRHSMEELAAILPTATHRRLAGQTHMVKPEVLAPVLVDFFAH